MTYLELATETAKDSTKYPRCGCVIVGKKILSIAHNLEKSHPIQAELNFYRFGHDDNCKHSLHAEINAILKVKDKTKLVGASIYIARIDSWGKLKDAFPCKACLRLIKKSGIKKIIYT
jgi:deoxycytidylate deaminase